MGNKPLKLAIFLETEIQAGGGHQQALNATLIVNKFPKDICQPIFVTLHKKNIPVLNKHGLQTVYLNISKLSKIIMLFKSKIRHPWLLRMINPLLKMNRLEKFLDINDIDLVYYTSPSELPKYTDKYNFIYTIWDLSHRDEVAFPEIREGRVFEQREEKYKEILPKATAVLVDSELGKDHVINRYGVDNNRVLVMPFSPAACTGIDEKSNEVNFIDIRKKYNLEYEYLFYPAQFWSHKNHVYILEGLKLLEEKHDVKIGAIFTGSDKGNKAHVKAMAKRLDIYTRIVFTGFVPNTEIPNLYKQSIALVMPSYFGPTNLPPMEAFQLGVPVIYGDIPGAKEQLANGALYLNLTDVNTFVESILILRNKGIRKSLVSKGKKQLKAIAKKRIDSQKDLVEIMKEYQFRRQCWA